MHNEKNKTLKCTQYEKPINAVFIIYADLESLIKKITGCNDNPENHQQEK